MNIKFVACLAFLLNTILFATYYAVAKEALGRIDPLMFTFFEMTALAPIALCILIFTRQDITRALVKRGVLLGSCLCLALFTIAIALKYTTATGTAFFPALNGFLAALIARIVLRRPIAKATWFAGLLSVIGTALLILNSTTGGARGSFIAFLGGLFFTWYVFLAGGEQHDEVTHLAHWPLFGIELLTMAAWASLVALLFGNWQDVHPSLPKDILVILYISGACTFLPTLITAAMQKYISPVTVSFIYILEPILGAIIANLYLHETLPLHGYIGGSLIVAGALIHTWWTAEHSEQEHTLQQQLSKNDRPLFFTPGPQVTPISEYLKDRALAEQKPAYEKAERYRVTEELPYSEDDYIDVPTLVPLSTGALSWELTYSEGDYIDVLDAPTFVQRHRRDSRQLLARVELVELVD